MGTANFIEAAKLPDTQFNLTEAALLFAKEEYPDLDLRYYNDTLKQIEILASKKISRSSGPEDSAITLSTLLFEKLGFHGNRENYYNVENSFLNRVIDTKKGIPITLSIIYLHVGRNLGLPITGVNFPGHFLVKCVSLNRDIIIDCFNGGRLLSHNDCSRMLYEMYGDSITFDRNMLKGTKSKDIICRLIGNLKKIYMQTKQYNKAIKMAEYIEIISPNLPENIRDKANIYLRTENLTGAISSLEKYLEIDPDAIDADYVKKQIRNIRSTLSKLN